MQNKNDLKLIIFWALIIRILFFLIVVFSQQLFKIEPYLFIDDELYESLARYYLENASSLIDLNTFKSSGGYYFLSNFWPWVVSISSYIFRTIFASRIINIMLSLINILFVYKITFLISNKHKTSLIASKVYAFLPYSIFVSVFPIKDIFLMFVVLFFFLVWLKYYYSKKIKFFEIIFLILILLAGYNTRGGIVELLISFFIISFFIKNIKKKNTSNLFFLTIILIPIVIYFFPIMLEELTYKFNSYIDYQRTDTLIKLVRIDNFYDLWKLPLTYLFSLLQPIKTNYFYFSSADIWSNILSLLNISIFPIAFSNFFYMFMKKENTVFWIFSTIIWFGAIILSLGIFRHYLFLTPFIYINFALFWNSSTRTIKSYIFFASVTLFLLFLFNTFINGF